MAQAVRWRKAHGGHGTGSEMEKSAWGHGTGSEMEKRARGRGTGSEMEKRAQGRGTGSEMEKRAWKALKVYMYTPPEPPPSPYLPHPFHRAKN